MALQMKYFVLNPESSSQYHAKASRLAMLAYADAIQNVDTQMAIELREWVNLVTPRSRHLDKSRK